MYALLDFHRVAHSFGAFFYVKSKPLQPGIREVVLKTKISLNF